MRALSLQTVAKPSRQRQLLHQAPERLGSPRQIEYALAMQTLQFTNVHLLPSLSYCPGGIKNHAESSCGVERVLAF